LPASIATPTARRTLAALFVFGGILSARAAEPPDNVQAEVAEAVQSCKDLEGTPKLKCEGGINQMCGANGCTLQIFLWDGGTAWNLAFEEPVHSYKFGKSRGKRVLQAE
jgi:hypothetical protein